MYRPAQGQKLPKVKETFKLRMYSGGLSHEHGIVIGELDTYSELGVMAFCSEVNARAMQKAGDLRSDPDVRTALIFRILHTVPAVHIHALPQYGWAEYLDRCESDFRERIQE